MDALPETKQAYLC